MCVLEVADMHKRILIDGQNMAHRMRHSHDDLAALDARPTGVLYGMLNQITFLIEQFSPDEILVIWEGKGKSWRKEFFPGYKSLRDVRREEYTKVEQEQWEEFINIQLPDTMHALQHFGIPQMSMDWWEADDTIAACCLKLGPKDTENIIISTDKDFLQLVEAGHTRMLNPTSEKMYYQDKGTSELKVSGVDVNDTLAPTPQVFLWRRYLIGDSSDCIPGIKGAGEKTAAKMLPGKEFPGESLTGYLTRHLQKKTSVVQSRVELAIRGVDQTLFRNERLMDLRHALRNVAPGGVECFCDDYIASTNGSKQFIMDGIEHADPNPLLSFFRALDFDFVTKPQRWRRIVKTFRRLNESHERMKRAMKGERDAKAMAI